jgi:hypothetical protein
MAAAVAHGDVQVVVVERMQLIGPKVNPHIVWPNLVSAHLMPASVRTERLGGVARDGQQSAIRQRQGELDFQAVPTAQRLDSIGVGLQRQVVGEQRLYLACAVCDQLQGWRVRVEDSYRARSYSTTPPLPNHSAAKPQSPKHSAATTESTSQSSRSALGTRRILICTTASLPRIVESFSTRVSEPTPAPSCGVDEADAVGVVLRAGLVTMSITNASVARQLLEQDSGRLQSAQT